MARFANVGGFILAGGESSRMGRDKALLEWDGEPLLLRAARLLGPLVGAPLVIAPPARYENLGLRLVADDNPGLGPLGGIATALRISLHPWNLVIGCDLPYLTPEWLAFLIERALASSADAALPVSAAGAEPLCAMYHRRAADAISAALGRGVRKVTDGLAGLAVLYLASDEWKAFDSGGRLFKNINAPAEYDAARAAPNRKAGK
jgi:molybdopterin-guanine dinucleotide biosynthesis protein A